MVTSGLPQIPQKKMSYPLFIEKITSRRIRSWKIKSSNQKQYQNLRHPNICFKENYIFFVHFTMSSILGGHLKNNLSSRYSGVSVSSSSWSEELLSCWQTWLFFLVVSSSKHFATCKSAQIWFKISTGSYFIWISSTSLNIFFSFNTIKVGDLDTSNWWRIRQNLKPVWTFLKIKVVRCRGLA